MGNVIYSASPFQAFSGALWAILLLLGLGLFSLAAALLRRNQSSANRIITGVLGIFLLVIGCVVAAFTFISFSSGSQTVLLKFDNKAIANQTCGENGISTCTFYVLSATTSTHAYDFDVSQDAYKKARLNVCYQITYYPNKGLFNTSSDSDSYQSISSVSRIEAADPSACQ